MTTVAATDALEIGHLVFHALNATEIGLASVILLVTLKANCSRHRRRISVLTGLMLATQSVLLYTAMDARTLAIINRTAPLPPSYHPIYVALEVVKLLLLIYLTHLQLEEYDAKITKTAKTMPDSAQGRPLFIHISLHAPGPPSNMTLSVSKIPAREQYLYLVKTARLVQYCAANGCCAARIAHCSAELGFSYGSRA